MLIMNFLIEFFVYFIAYFLINLFVNLFVWMVLSKSFKKDYFYPALLYASSVSIIMGLRDIIALFGKKYYIDIINLSPTFFASLFRLVMIFFAYFVLPRYVLKRYAAHYADAKVINRVLLISFISIIILKIAIALVVTSWFAHTAGGWGAFIEKIKSMNPNAADSQLVQ